MARKVLVLEQARLDLNAELAALDLSTDQGAARLTEIEAQASKIDAAIHTEKVREDLIRSAPVAQSHNHDVSVHDNAADKPFASIGEQMLAIRAASNPGVPIHPRLLQLNDVGAVALGHNVSVPSEGGYLLESSTISALWQRVYETGQIINRCFRVPIGDNTDSVKINAIDESSRATGSRFGGVRAYWLAEAGTFTASMTQFRQMELAPKKMGVLVYATGEMLRNTGALEAIINQVVPQEISFTAENAIVRGDGVGKPLGFLVSPALISIAAEGGQGATTLIAENISKMWARMPARNRANAVWLINQDVESQLDALSFPVGVGGALLYMPPGGLSEAPYGRIKGRPVIPVEYASTLGAVGDISLVDLSQYAIADRGGVNVASSIHVQFLTDQTAFRFIYSIDGEPLWNTPLVPFQGAGSTQSPFVTIAAR